LLQQGTESIADVLIMVCVVYPVLSSTFWTFIY